MSQPAIKIENLVKSFEGKVALDGVSLEIFSGELFGLIGPDGAGKTTLMRILCGLLDADQGFCWVLGKDVSKEQKKVRTIIGYMPERFSLYPDLSVNENLKFFAQLFQVPEEERRQREKRLLEFSGLDAFQTRRAGQLSGGMKQKLALACTLVHQPKVLILDEPTTGVDPVSRDEFWKILGELRQAGTTILISTPYLDEAEVCDRVALIYRGKILACAKPKQLVELFPGELFELSGENLILLAKKLKDVKEILDVQLFGDRLHLHLEKDKNGRKVILQALESLNRTDLVPQKISPRLENIFAWLIKQAEERE